ncbi:LEA type 2 family protein [Winogradskyella sp. HB-48]|uniref:LEA type 2 family protein n=1 Tax=Winogradskyella sp. HB-48 TaxID=3416808 RepID=UPI003CE8DD0E
MKKSIVFILVICSLVFNCTFREKPQFIGIDNFKVLDSNIENITISADAEFSNPNDLGGTLQTDALKVFVNDKEIAIFNSKEFEVPSKNTFKIPLTVSVATDSIIDKSNLSGFLGSLLSKKIKVQYKGDIKYKVLGYSSSYKVDKTEDIKIKL